MARVAITGAAGSIGSELYRQLCGTETVLAFDIDETRLFDLHEEYKQKGCDVHYVLGDVRDRELVRKTIKDFKPDVIFHVAALKHVTPHESEPEQAVYTNVVGSLNVIQEAKEQVVENLIYVSTDKAVNQHCVMGTTKRLGEIMARNAGYVAVRFGNVMESRGSVFEIWKRQVESGEPMTITDEKMERYLMTIPEACELLIQAYGVGEKGDLLVMDMGERVKLLDIARKFLEERGLKEYPFKQIGIRAGETLKERLMTEEEESVAVREGNFYIVKHGAQY